MKKLLLCFSFIFIFTACSSKGPAPIDVDDMQIEFEVLNSKEKPISKKPRSYLCKFSDNNTYQSYENGKSLHAGNYSYSRTGSHSARIVFSYSENNALKSYEMSMLFENVSSGTWESSFNNTELGAQSGRFEIK